jgi:Ser-tRNA(Ala) deacylase AlaX
MKSKLLRRMVKEDPSTWCVAPILDDDGNEYRDRAMVKKGALSQLVIAHTNKDGIVDDALEKKVMGVVKDLVDRDRNMMMKNLVIFSAVAQASVSCCMQFVGLVERQAKVKLNQYVQNTERLVKAIQGDNVSAYGKPMEDMLENLEDAAHVVYQKFADTIEVGKLAQFMDHVDAFDTTETPEAKMEVEK